LHAFSQRYNWRRVPFCLDRWGAHGAEQSTVAFAFEAFDRFIWECNAGFLESLPTGFVVRKGKLEAKGRRERFEDAAACGDDFTANAVAGDQA
jgi:hypothetical protein